MVLEQKTLAMKQALPVGNILLGLLYMSIAVAILVAAMLAVPTKTSSLRPSHVPDDTKSADSPAGSKAKAVLGGQVVFVEIADTPTSQEHGLSGHKKLGADEGMLFVFVSPGEYGFWMKDMRFPIDIIWLDQNLRVADVWENAEPSSYPKIFTPRAPSQYVLEVPAGFFAKHQLKIGNILEILK